MNKSQLRKEYEARMGVVEGSLCLYNERGEGVYYENAKGYWSRYEYQAGKEVYYENSHGTVTDNRPSKAKTFTDENGTQYKLVEITK